MGVISISCTRISIHAPRGGSDAQTVTPEKAQADFNPRSPWGERLSFKPRRFRTLIFQSTLPVGGATRIMFGNTLAQEFQSTLPVGGATLVPWSFGFCRLISIHAPRGGSDLGSV